MHSYIYLTFLPVYQSDKELHALLCNTFLSATGALKLPVNSEEIFYYVVSVISHGMYVCPPAPPPLETELKRASVTNS